MAEVVELRGGLVVRVDALAFALALESAGHTLSVRDGRLMVSRGQELSPTDQEQVRTLKTHLMAIATYQAPPPAWVQAAQTEPPA